jgi:hypothetical protein
MQRDHAHELHAVGMDWIDRKRLLAAKLSTGMPSGLEVGESRLKERIAMMIHQTFFNLD